MNDGILSLTTRVELRPIGHCTEMLGAEQICELSAGFARVLEGLGPELASCLELVKITPWKALPTRDAKEYRAYDVRIVLTLGVKFDWEMQVGIYYRNREHSLSDAFYLKVTEEIRTRLSTYAHGLDRTSKHIKGLIPAQAA